MELGLVGLGKMGGAMARRLMRGGHKVLVYDLSPSRARELEREGAIAACAVEDLVRRLSTPRVVWLMVPAGEAVDSALKDSLPMLSRGDAVIDGGNSNYKDTLRRSAWLAESGVDLVDVGTSGGIWGLDEGYCLMVGGDKAVVDRLSPLFKTLAPDHDKGWGHVGPTGAGHFVKMVHNGIEYGLMEAYAEGLEILHAKKDLGLDVAQIAAIWRHGSVVRSWLLDITAPALAEDPDLTDVKGWVADTGEGRWTVAESIDLDVPAPAIALSLMARLRSRQEESYGAKVLAAMRNRFGGHEIKPTGRRVR